MTPVLIHTSRTYTGPSSGSGAGNSGGAGLSIGGSGGAGGGGSGRRLISEFPPHIQQLLDQQDRQGFERGSPLRRPVYRKVVAGSGIVPPVQYDGSLPTYLLPGRLMLIYCGTLKCSYCGTIFTIFMLVHEAWSLML